MLTLYQCTCCWLYWFGKLPICVHFIAWLLIERDYCEIRTSNTRSGLNTKKQSLLILRKLSANPNHFPSTSDLHVWICLWLTREHTCTWHVFPIIVDMSNGRQQERQQFITPPPRHISGQLLCTNIEPFSIWIFGSQFVSIQVSLSMTALHVCCFQNISITFSMLYRTSAHACCLL